MFISLGAVLILQVHIVARSGVKTGQQFWGQFRPLVFTKPKGPQICFRARFGFSNIFYRSHIKMSQFFQGPFWRVGVNILWDLTKFWGQLGLMAHLISTPAKDWVCAQKRYVCKKCCKTIEYGNRLLGHNIVHIHIWSKYIENWIDKIDGSTKYIAVLVQSALWQLKLECYVFCKSKLHLGNKMLVWSMFYIFLTISIKK